MPHAIRLLRLDDSITQSGLVLAIDIEVQWRVTYISGCLILAVGQAGVFDAMTNEGDWCNLFLLYHILT